MNYLVTGNTSNMVIRQRIFTKPGKVCLIFGKVFFWESSVFDSVLKQRKEAVAQRCFFQKVVLRNLAKFTGKHLCQSLFFNEVAG